VNALLKDIEAPKDDSDDGEWGGIQDDAEPIDHEEEYVDEDRYTTVTVEEVDVSKEGLHKVTGNDDSDENLQETKPEEKEATGKKTWPKKPRKKKFRYESKVERKFTRSKQKAGNKAKADARRGND